MSTADQIKKAVDHLDEEQRQALLFIIHTWQKNDLDIEEVDPDEFDLKMYEEYKNSSEEDKEYISEKEALQELNLWSSTVNKRLNF